MSTDKHTLHPGDAERLETLKLLRDSSGDDLEALCDQGRDIQREISAKRAEFAQRCRDVEEFEAAMAGMGVKA